MVKYSQGPSVPVICTLVRCYISIPQSDIINKHLFRKYVAIYGCKVPIFFAGVLILFVAVLIFFVAGIANLFCWLPIILQGGNFFGRGANLFLQKCQFFCRGAIFVVAGVPMEEEQMEDSFPPRLLPTSPNGITLVKVTANSPIHSLHSNDLI